MSNFSCKTLDYVNPNDVGGGRESTERVFAAATRDQFQSRSRYVQEGWAATWMLSAQQSVERMVQGCQGNTQSQPGQTKSFPSSLWLSWSPTLHCLCRTLVSASPPRSFGRESSEHRDLLAGKPALGVCGVGSLWRKSGSTGRVGGFVSPHTRCISPGWEEI